MTPILGIMASQISGHLFTPTGSMFHIASTTLSTTAASITFSSIAADYTHLQIRALGMFTGTVGVGNISFNGDNASSNYSFHTLHGDGSTAGASGSASQNQGRFTAIGGTTPSYPTAMVMDILDYANTNKYKTVRHLFAWDGNGSGYVEFDSNNWRSTNAITSITFTPANTFNTYSSFSLYGVK